MATQNAKNKDEGRGPTTSQTAGEQAGGMMEKAREAASSVGRSAGEAAASLGHKAEDAASAVAGGMRSLAGQLREHTPREGVLGTAASSVAQTLEQSGRYLEQEGFGGMVDDLSAVIRRNPIPAVLIGIGLGFLLARTTSRS